MTNINFDDFTTAYQQARILNGQCNILVIGKTGVGKSTLINAIFGKKLAEARAGKPITKNIEKYTITNSSINIYDSPGLELSSNNLWIRMFFDHNVGLKKDVYDLIETKSKLAPKEHIHIIWYCINKTGHRIEEDEKDWLKELSSKGLSVILVLTKSINNTNDEDEFQNYLRNIPVSGIIPVLAKSQRIDTNYTVKAHGLDLLVNKTAKLLPEVATLAFANALKNIDLRGHTATIWLIHAYLPSAFLGSSLVPIPVFGSKVSTATVQMAMLAHISRLFELPFDLAFISTLFSAASGISLELFVEEILNIDSIKDILKQGLNNFTEWIHYLLHEFPIEIPVFGGVIAGSSAVVSTLVLGLAYIDVVKIYKQEEFEGNFISVSELGIMLRKRIEYYAKPGWETLKVLLAGNSSNFAQSL